VEKVLNFYGCRNGSHLRNECLELAKAKGKSNSFGKSRGRRAYIAWEEDDATFILCDLENDEVSHLCFIGQKKKRNGVTYSDSDSKFNPSYGELQKSLAHMHGDAINCFKKPSAQNKVIIKLEAVLS